MKIVLTLLLLSLAALGDQPFNHRQTKPAMIQDGSAAESYISAALYDYLDKPPYLAINSATPFLSKEIEGKNLWISLVDFCCGVSEEQNLHCTTVIVYDPVTNEHRFMNPDDLPGIFGGESI
jgi:hypothetical protein